jgi:hypothetical protein
MGGGEDRLDLPGFFHFNNMSRPDLLALNPDDLAVLTNRGTVKRAQREVDSGEVSAVWEEAEDGRIQATWADDVVCLLPGGKTIREARCTCPATELCRHIVRTVIAWQVRVVTSTGESGAEETPSAPAPPLSWNPGTLTEAHVEEHASKALLAKAKAAWDRGVLAECVTGPKPWARFYDLGLSVRFPVPGDIRYAHCDCGQPGPCLHALLAVAAFRKMPPTSKAALIAHGDAEAASNLTLLAEAEQIVESLGHDGIGGIPAAVVGRWKRAANALHEAGIIWLAGLVEDLLLCHERYQNRDALFSPDQLASLTGELLLRCDALRHGTGIPRGLAGGWKSAEKTEIDYSRWIGLGSLVTTHRKSVTLGAYFQEADSGSLGIVTREVADPDDHKTELSPFSDLARGGIVKGAGIRLLGAGQVLTESCRRTPDNRLSFGRARAQVSAQAYDWARLRAPVLVEDFGELRTRLQMLPPRSLRPRRAGEDFHVLPISAHSVPKFDPTSQLITATLQDHAGGTVQLRLPWTARSAAGCEAVLTRIPENSLRYVSGEIGLSAHGPTINPAALILSGGGTISMIQPWVDDAPAASSGGNSSLPVRELPNGTNGGAIPAVWATCGALLAEWLMIGANHQSTTSWQLWEKLHEEASQSGSPVAAAVAGEIINALHREREGQAKATAGALGRALVAWRAAVDVG